MRKRQILIALIVLALALTSAPRLPAIEKSLTLEIGDPARKDKKADLVLDAITDTRTGELLSPAEVAERLADKRLVLVGESHTDINFHRAQLRIIQELNKAGRQVGFHARGGWDVLGRQGRHPNQEGGRASRSGSGIQAVS